jgi:hypothetical protein
VRQENVSHVGLAFGIAVKSEAAGVDRDLAIDAKGGQMLSRIAGDDA